MTTPSYWWTVGQGQVGVSRIWDGVSLYPTIPTLTVKARSLTLTAAERDYSLTAQRRSFALTATELAGVYLPALAVLEDNSGYWLFEDGSRVMFEPGDEGAPLTVRERSFTLTGKDR